MAGQKPMNLPHTLYFSSLRNWLALLRRYGGQFEGRQRVRAAVMTAFITATVPIRVWESIRHHPAVRRHQLSEPPVFIVGHWRSGTTNTHNLLLQDQQFTSVTLLHCAIAHAFLSCGWLARKIMTSRLPRSRPMDAVPLGMDEPMSEDFALATMTHMSHYLNYFFPRIADLTFRRTVLFEDVSQADIDHFGRMYDFLLKKVSYASGGKRLLLKNPPSLGRIPEMLKRYPDARFIHVYRDPWKVHASTMKLMKRFTEQLSFQGCTYAEIESFVSDRYRLLMDRWFETRVLIPEGQLVEVRHEDITARPLEVVGGIYEKLNLSGWTELRPRLKAYAATLEGYRNNAYEFSPDYLDRIGPFLRPIAERLGYREPGESTEVHGDVSAA